eukprot:CAMPEP_0170549650 /NCGR_PEP_ID=MMETSP0211-20121228/7805_1 /TAXON_ID=311385 /ORGANISM="Pseudokeronopsis sp., Strain OXSARD2" /LENGTH=208 /DNA_ID=CAMNT_0010855795 /DNA_START=277 /DNA_END=903 /DNA_ORIENTATION=-
MVGQLQRAFILFIIEDMVDFSLSAIIALEVPLFLLLYDLWAPYQRLEMFINLRDADVGEGVFDVDFGGNVFITDEVVAEFLLEVPELAGVTEVVPSLAALQAVLILHNEHLLLPVPVDEGDVGFLVEHGGGSVGVGRVDPELIQGGEEPPHQHELVVFVLEVQPLVEVEGVGFLVPIDKMPVQPLSLVPLHLIKGGVVEGRNALFHHV